MAEHEPKETRFDYEKVAAYSLLLSETLFAILKDKGLLTQAEVNQHMEKLNKELLAGEEIQLHVEHFSHRTDASHIK